MDWVRTLPWGLDTPRRGGLTVRSARATVCPAEELQPYQREVRMSPLNAVTIEIAWCPACQADRTMEIIALDGDQWPVAVCVNCGIGMETWWLPESITEARPGAKAS